MNDFDRVASLIRFLEQHRQAQPSLAEVAAACGLSQTHAHRLFQRWAGLTPKDFLQCLTLEHAKRRLRESASVLEAALDSGLSGPGRLHDLFVTIDAMSPGEYQRGGASVELTWGMADSPFGRCSIGWNARGLGHLAFHDARNGRPEPATLREDWPGARLMRDDREAGRWAKAIFREGHPPAAPLRVCVRATRFQLKVWRALLRIPAGCVTSYGALAAALGDPRATRAVGAACGANPVAYLIPCHRVIRETGAVEGYRWGATRKRAMLAREACGNGGPSSKN